MKKTLTGIAALAAAALMLTACSGGNPGDGGGDGAGTTDLKIGNLLDVQSWDPSLADIGFDGPYLSAVYDSLLALDADGQVIPSLATEWKVSDDFTTITMDLRDGVKFSDGADFDADAAVKSLEYLKKGATSQEAYLKVKSFEAVDDDTIAIHLKQRDDTILYFMGLGRSYMMSPKAIDAGTLADTPVGSGPYVRDEKTSVAGSEYHFTRTPDYWDAKDYDFETVSILPIGDQTALHNAMLSGQVNVIYADPANNDQAKQQGWNVTEQVASWVGFQVTDRVGKKLKPLGDVRVRQALLHAFDTKSILESVGAGSGTLTNQVFPADLPGYLPELNDMYGYDPAKAKELLAEAGYPDGFEISMPMAPLFQPWQAVVEQSLGDIGITVKWDDMQMGDYMTNAANYALSVTVTALDSNPIATVDRQVAKPQWYNPDPQVDQFPELQKQVDAVYAAEGDAQTEAVEELNRKLTDLAWFSVWYQSDNTFYSTADIRLQPTIGTMFPQLRNITKK